MLIYRYADVSQRYKEAAHGLWWSAGRTTIYARWPLKTQGQIDVVYGLWSEFMSGYLLCMQDYQFLHVAL